MTMASQQETFLNKTQTFLYHQKVKLILINFKEGSILTSLGDTAYQSLLNYWIKIVKLSLLEIIQQIITELLEFL